MSPSETVDFLLSYCDELKKYVSTLEEERDNYELLLKYLGVYDDNVEVHKFEDIIDKIRTPDTPIAETVDIIKVTKDNVVFRINCRNSTLKTVSVPLTDPYVS